MAGAQQILEAIFRLFTRHDRWPTWSEVDYELDRTLGLEDPWGEVSKLDRRLLWGAGAHEPPDDQKIALTIEGLAQCPEAAEDAAIFVEGVRYAAQLAQDSPPSDDVLLTPEDLARHVRLPAAGRASMLARQALLWETVGGLWLGFSKGQGEGDWKILLRRKGLRPFRGVRDLADYLARDAAVSGVGALPGSGQRASVGAMPREDERGPAAGGRQVFVVHGRNEALRRSMFDFLRSIDLSPMEWTTAVEWTGDGSPYIGQVLDVAFDRATAVVVLLTPDEVAYLQPRYGSGADDPEIAPAPQARPNVLFEAGMALGRDARRTVLVEVGSVRPFSDVAGRHVVRLSNDLKRRQELAKRLETAGCAVNLSGTDWHSAGDFTAPSPPGEGLPLGRRVPAATTIRPPIDFDVKYFSRGGNHVDKLQIVNRGTEVAYDVTLSVPEDAALDLMRHEGIPKIPGGGKSVTIDVMNRSRLLGGRQGTAAFDVSVSARTDAGAIFTQDVFLDLNG
ncbi:TIR domain-containing protein [Actinotalea fermentans]|uniref:CD-NTase-associated protein 12/Pycsar effector protein TIR domain-containing protein n=1 Tax=Actinotalea fermentans TaxID=43671 RepID=A0A511YWA4_9CELL|nr:nucleotide-binding protein [Actinotalea fermentans]KGM17532.1 hypothetical protein N867_01340 [Actinotalea fermentans ATCC 43279 = JCM 9966 = DSM 3133]GEN79487.1 hypothetical protein AFE02nite_12210 [Actinotalea fermentans]